MIFPPRKVILPTVLPRVRGFDFEEVRVPTEVERSIEHFKKAMIEREILNFSRVLDDAAKMHLKSLGWREPVVATGIETGALIRQLRIDAEDPSRNTKDRAFFLTVAERLELLWAR